MLTTLTALAWLGTPLMFVGDAVLSYFTTRKHQLLAYCVFIAAICSLLPLQIALAAWPQVAALGVFGFFSVIGILRRLRA